MMRTILLSIILCAMPWCADAQQPKDIKRVLFIFVDDLNSMIGAFGDDVAITPNIDRLATEAVTFTDCYCQSPACNSSRASVLSGLYPYRTGIHTNGQPIRTALPGRIMMPQWFRQNGFDTSAFGKVYHYKGPESHYGDPASWDVSRQPDGTRFGLRPSSERVYSRSIVGPGTGSSGLPIGVWDSPLTTFPDADTATRTITRIRELEAQETCQPWLISCGFVLPHLNWIVPKPMWEMYNPEDINFPTELPLSQQRVPLLAGSNSGDGVLALADRREAVRAYLSAITFIDWNVGRLLDELEALGIAEETLIVLSSDHGYNLGEHGRYWQKWNLWDETARTPMLIKAPNAGGSGEKCRRVVELLDIFPTLFDVCGLPPYPHELDGRSLVPLLEEPTATWDYPAFTERVLLAHGRNGRSVRYGQYRLIEWRGEYQMYDLEDDPREQNNLVHVGVPGARALPIARDSSLQPLVDQLHGMFPPDMDLYLQRTASAELPSAGVIVDRDGDGLSIDEELALGSSDLRIDTDSDGFVDMAERDLGFDPRGDDSERIAKIHSLSHLMGLIPEEELLTGMPSLILERDPVTKNFTVDAKIAVSEDLTRWENHTIVDDVEFAVSSDRRFLRLLLGYIPEEEILNGKTGLVLKRDAGGFLLDAKISVSENLKDWNDFKIFENVEVDPSSAQKYLRVVTE